jgi:hypothetical protein
VAALDAQLGELGDALQSGSDIGALRIVHGARARTRHGGATAGWIAGATDRAMRALHFALVWIRYEAIASAASGRQRA